MRPTLNIVGCGRLGKTLTRLWHDNGLVTVNQVLNTSETSGCVAVDFIGAGSAIRHIDQFSPVDFWLIASGDQSISKLAQQLAEAAPFRRGNVVFHCSGALASDILEPIKASGALACSVHPMHAFSEPQTSLVSFAGSYCAAEGDDEALKSLLPLFEHIGGKTITIESRSKLLYHSASVIGSNFLVALLDASLKTFAAAGIDHAQAAALLRPITHAMIDSVLDSDPANALTGPIVRGDGEVIEKQLSEIEGKLPELGALYRALGLHNVELAKTRGQASQENLAQLFEILSK